MDQDSRKDFAFLTLAGQNVSVHTSDGAVWEGVFVATDAKASESVVLYAAVRTPTQDYSGSEPASYLERCYIPMHTVMSINAIDVKMQTGNTATEKVAPSRPAPLPENPNSIKWDEEMTTLDNFAEEEKNWKAGKSWDQFADNEKKFGVKSTYDPNLYTTKLSNNYSASQIAHAERLARDIENSAVVGGIQQRIERGEDIDVDEGELYSDVKRVDSRAPAAAPKKEATPLPSGKAGSYVPPSKRGATTTTTGAPPQQPAATIPPPVTASPANASPAPAAAPSTAPVNSGEVPGPAKPFTSTVPISPSASASETPKTTLNVAAKAWTPGMPSAAPAAPAVDFMTAFTNCALELLGRGGSNQGRPDATWFPEAFPQNAYGQGGFQSGGYSNNASQGYGYSEGYNVNYNQQQGNSGYNSGMAGHQMQQSGYGNQQFNNPPQQFGGNPNPQNQQQNPQQQQMSSAGFRGRGRGGMQPQQPSASGFGRGGMGMGGGASQPNAPQPLDSGSDAPTSAAPAPVSQPEPQETAKPKVMKRGR